MDVQEIERIRDYCENINTGCNSGIIYKRDVSFLLAALRQREEEIATLRREVAKYKLFWEEAREADRMSFDTYVWEPRALAEENFETHEFQDSCVDTLLAEFLWEREKEG